MPGRTYAAARANVCNADGMCPIVQCGCAVGSAPPLPIHIYVYISTCLTLEESYMLLSNIPQKDLTTTSGVYTEHRRAALH